MRTLSDRCVGGLVVVIVVVVVVVTCPKNGVMQVA
jgi:hypothetical protein